jgi:hypothetical protein
MSKQKLKKYLTWQMLIGLLVALFLFYGIGASMIVIGIIFGNGWWVSAGTAYIIFMAQPLIPLWLLIPAVAIGIAKLIKKIQSMCIKCDTKEQEVTI